MNQDHSVVSALDKCVRRVRGAILTTSSLHRRRRLGDVQRFQNVHVRVDVGWIAGAVHGSVVLARQAMDVDFKISSDDVRVGTQCGCRVLQQESVNHMSAKGAQVVEIYGTERVHDAFGGNEE